MIGPISLEAKQMGARSAGNPHAALRRGGGWKRGTAEILGHSQTKGRANRGNKLRPKLARQSSTLPMRGMWKRSYGRATKAPPDERGGNRRAWPTATAPHPDSTRLTRSRRVSRTAGVGHEERFPPPSLRGSCWFQKRSAVVGDWAKAGFWSFGSGSEPFDGAMMGSRPRREGTAAGMSRASVFLSVRNPAQRRPHVSTLASNYSSALLSCRPAG